MRRPPGSKRVSSSGSRGRRPTHTANRDPAAFEHPNEPILDPKGYRHFRFGLACTAASGPTWARDGVQVDADTIGVIQYAEAAFTPGKRLGVGLDETLDSLARICREQELTCPITECEDTAVIDGGLG